MFKPKAINVLFVLLTVLLGVPMLLRAQPSAREWLVVTDDDHEWRAVSTNVPTSAIVTTPQAGSVWGVLIPGSPAKWIYANSFDTGPVTQPGQSTIRTFTRTLGSQLVMGYPGLQKAEITITADNGYVLYVTGSEVGRTFHSLNLGSSRPVYSSDWKNVQTYDIRPYLRRGLNDIRVDVADYGGKAGLLMEARFRCDTECWIPEGIPIN